MAKLFGDKNGAIAGLAITADQEQFFLRTNVAPVTTLDFDETANAALLVDVQANQGLYTLKTVNSLSVLQKSGVNVTVAPADSYYTLKSAILNGFTDAQIRSVITALWNGTATSAQQQKAIAYIAAKLKLASLI